MSLWWCLCIGGTTTRHSWYIFVWILLIQLEHQRVSLHFTIVLSEMVKIYFQWLKYITKRINMELNKTKKKNPCTKCCQETRKRFLHLPLILQTTSVAAGPQLKQFRSGYKTLLFRIRILPRPNNVPNKVVLYFFHWKTCRLTFLNLNKQ